MSKVIKTCQACNKEFSVYPAAVNRRKTCSRECGYEILRVDHKKPKPCTNCGELTTNPKYCSNTCQKEFEYIKCKERDIKLFHSGELISRRNIRPLLEQRDGRRCNCCNLEEWLGKPITLWVDHIDGNATNNDPNNLRLICPNCDSQSDTFGGKNRGNGRRSHGLKPWQ